MVTDSLRYWAAEMHIDGFRFDLATILGREPYGFDEGGGFLDSCRQDPVLSRVKLIAEPWDCGPGGYQVGGFPPGWAEWNDRYRDTVRKYWKGDPDQAPELASRLAASADFFNRRGRKPWASVNFITAHDGFTLNDLVSYNEKHNEANGENNQDGTSNNNSWNCGAEGPADDKGVRQLRERQKRNLLATLLLSQGTPMILAGDEFGRSQRGNNNAYCQDNEISWLDWEHIGPDGHALTEFARKLALLRQSLPVLRRGRFLTGAWNDALGVKDVTWLRDAAGRARSGDRNHPVRRRRHPADRPQCASRRGSLHLAGCRRTRPLVLPARHQRSRSRRDAVIRDPRSVPGHRKIAAAVRAGGSRRDRPCRAPGRGRIVPQSAEKAMKNAR
jgi:glycogen operon protein